METVIRGPEGKEPGDGSQAEVISVATAFYRDNGYPRFIEELINYCFDQQIRTPAQLLGAIRGPSVNGPVEYVPEAHCDGQLDRSAQTRVMVISSNLSRELVLAGAVHSSVGLVIYDAKQTTLESLLRRITAATNGLPADSIGIIDHGGPGTFNLLEGVEVSEASLADENGELARLFVAIGELIKPEGRIDLLACNLLATDAGTQLVKRIETLSRRAVGASADVTGDGGNFVLERGQIDVAATYFDVMRLAQWHSCAEKIK